MRWLIVKFRVFGGSDGWFQTTTVVVRHVGSHSLHTRGDEGRMRLRTSDSGSSNIRFWRTDSVNAPRTWHASR